MTDGLGATHRVDPRPWADLHSHSHFSFLDGASHPEQLVEEAERLGLEALALTDHDGLYGVVRFAEAARAVGLPTVFGAEITLAAGPRDDRRARSEADRLYREGERRAHEVAEYAGDYYDEMSEMVRRKPAQALGIAAGVGFLVGLILARR